MPDKKKILIAHSKQDTRDVLEEAVRELGHEVVDVLASGKQIIDACLNRRPDLIITGVKMPDMDGIDALIRVAKENPLPGIIVTPDADLDLVERAVEDHVMAYLVEPVTKDDLKPAIHLVVLRYQQFQQLHEQIENLTDALDARKVIEKAKGILMKRTELDESEAFQRLQKLASSERKKLVDVAQAILTSDKVFDSE